MDELVNNLGSCTVTKHENSPYNEHPRFSQYKAKNTGASQQERRKYVLEARRDARYDLLMHLRQLEEHEHIGEDNSNESMDCEKIQAIYARPKKYRNFVMLSEWLVDIPEDFATSYIAQPCPVGKRSLVVAARGRTRCYARNGALIKEFRSLLPGGSKRHRNGYTVLDCIWSQHDNTYYIIDLVLWVNQSFVNCDTIFRLEWLITRISESDDVAQVSNINNSRFLPIPYTDCSSESLTKLLSSQLPFDVELDGVLFYHRDSHYTHGPTPLVGWLKGYMFPEILGISVPETFMTKKPDRYVDLPSHIEHGKIQREKRWKEKMDVNITEDNQKGKTKSSTASSKLTEVQDSGGMETTIITGTV